MRRAALFLALFAIEPTAAATPEWRQATDVELRLFNFAITPGTIHLKAGQPIRLRLINNSPGNYVVSSRDFFSAATIRQRDAATVAGGTIRVPSGETREIVLVPAKGSYRVYSTNLFYRIFGMLGQINVD